MTEDDVSYYRRRAEAELDRAQMSTVPCVVQAHYELAEAYLGKLEQRDLATGDKPWWRISIT